MKQLRYKINLFFSSISEQFKKDKIDFVFKCLCYLFAFLCIGTLPMFTYVSGLNLITNILSILFSLCVILYVFIRGKIYISYYVIFLTAFLLYGFLITIISRHIFITTTLRSMVTLYSLCFVIFFFVTNFNSTKFLLASYCIGIFMLCCWFFIEYRSEILSLNFERLGSAFGNENAVGAMISIGAVILSYYAFFKKGLYILYLIPSCMFIAFALFTGSRTALIICVLGTILNIYLLFGKKKIFWYFLTICGILLIGFLILLLPPFQLILSRLLQAFTSFFTPNVIDQSATTRFNMMQDALYFWRQNLIFGFGSDGFRASGGFKTYSHSSVSELLCSFGVVGFVLFYVPFVLPLIKKKKGNYSYLYFVLFIVLMIVTSILSVTYYAKYVLIVMTTLVGQSFMENIENEKYILLDIKPFKKKIHAELVNFKKYANNEKECLK